MYFKLFLMAGFAVSWIYPKNSYSMQSIDELLVGDAVEVCQTATETCDACTEDQAVNALFGELDPLLAQQTGSGTHSACMDDLLKACEDCKYSQNCRAQCPKKGDCSSMAAYIENQCFGKHYNLKCPPTSDNFCGKGKTHIPLAECHPGDVVCKMSGTNHVGVFSGEGVLVMGCSGLHYEPIKGGWTKWEFCVAPY